MRHTDEMDAVRRVIQGLTVNGRDPLTNRLLFEALGLEREQDKARTRSRVNDLVKRGELSRVEDGKFMYNPKARFRSGEMFQRVWRAIRSAKPGFSWPNIAQVSRVSYTTVRRYGQWLVEEGYLERHGRNGATLLYRGTAACRDTVETPYPPLDPRDPFEAERNAACRLIRLFMERDPYQPSTRKKIIEAATAILDRFTKEEPDHGPDDTVDGDAGN